MKNSKQTLTKVENMKAQPIKEIRNMKKKMSNVRNQYKGFQTKHYP